MKDKLRQYVDLLFAGAVNNEKNNELKEELLGNLYDRYDDFVASGMSEDEAYNSTISSIGDLSELLEKSRQEHPSASESSEAQTSTQKRPLYSEEEIQKKKKLHPILHAVAVSLYILCVIPAIIFDSNLSAAMLFALVAAATAIFIYTSYTKPVLVPANLSEKELLSLAENRHRAGIMRAAGVALYITCVCPVILIDSTFSIILMFGMIAAATAVMILTSSLFPINIECEPQFKDDSGSSKEKTQSSPYRTLGKIISGILWTAVVVIYFAVSFTTNRWLITWLIFPLAGLASGIISGIFNLICSRKIAGSIVKISLCSLFLCILLPLFTAAVSIDELPLSFLSLTNADSSFYVGKDDSSYTLGNTEVDAEGISGLDISWVSGRVTVEVWEKNYIDIRESGRDDELSRNAVHSKIEDGKLIIKFSEEQKRGLFFFGSQETKNLTVKIPESELLKHLEINSISSDIELYGLDGFNFDIENVSGDITAKDCFFGSIEAEAVSGDLELSGGCRSLEVSMVSGKVTLALQSVPEEISVETVSGSIEVSLPEDISGFTLSADTVSGSTNISYPTETKNGNYVFGDGSTRIEVEAVSGSITVK